MNFLNFEIDLINYLQFDAKKILKKILCYSYFVIIESCVKNVCYFI